MNTHQIKNISHYGFLDEDGIITQKANIIACNSSFSRVFKKGLIVTSFGGKYFLRNHSVSDDLVISTDFEMKEMRHNNHLKETISYATDIEKISETHEFDIAFLDGLNSLNHSIYNEKSHLIIDNVDNPIADGTSSFFGFSKMRKWKQFLCEIALLFFLVFCVSFLIYFRKSIFSLLRFCFSTIKFILVGEKKKTDFV